MDQLATRIKTSPEAYPHSLDVASDTVSFMTLSEADYARASFLDARVLTAASAPDAIAWPRVAAAVDEAALPERLGLIFHIGHVGSTLLSRLLGAHRNVLALREPDPYRTLARIDAELGSPDSAWDRAAFDQRLGVLLKLWSRGFRPGQLAVVKATSICCGLAAAVLARPSRPPAIFMFTRPEVYLATLFGGENNHLDIRGAAPLRERRLNRRLGGVAVRLDEMSYAQVTAMSWACEMAALADAARTAGGRVLWLDFERLLVRPQARLAEAFAHLGVAADPADIAEIVAGPELGRYSKAPEHAYDAGLRAQVLAQARGLHGDWIAEGMAWLERAGAEHPAVEVALEAAGSN